MAYHRSMETKQYSDLEREVIILAAVWDLIGSMVHYGHFETTDKVNEIVLPFKTQECSRLFIIILADFLSRPRPGTFGLKHRKGEDSLAQTYLGYLEDVTVAPHFKGDTALLVNSVHSFAEWLDGHIMVDGVWLPSIERNGPLDVQRMTYLKICGTISKHGFTRLGNIVEKLRKVLSENDTEIDDGQSYLIIPEFQEWFRDNIFLANSTRIACFLNEIRWGIFEYLRTEFERAYRPTGKMQEPQMYEYDIPAEITDRLVQSIYWDLMNEIRSRPYFPRFSADPSLDKKY
jgi:hypothetical protein